MVTRINKWCKFGKGVCIIRPLTSLWRYRLSYFFKTTFLMKIQICIKDAWFRSDRLQKSLGWCWHRASDEHFALRIKMFGNVWSNKGIIFWQLSHYRHQNLIPQKSGVIFFHTNTFQKNFLSENMLKSTQNEFLIKKKPNQTQFLNQIKCLFQISDLMYTSVFFIFKKILGTIISGVFCKPCSFKSKKMI